MRMKRCEAGLTKACNKSNAQRCECCGLYLCPNHHHRDAKNNTYEVTMRLKGNYDRGQILCKGSLNFCNGYLKGTKDFSKIVGSHIFLEISESLPQKYLIMKSTRARDDFTVTPRNAYAQPQTCGKAGIPPGKVYETREEAETDAEKLSIVNPVGFVVVQV